jgi:hypothetical protein
MALCLECCGELNATGSLPRPRLAVVPDEPRGSQVYNQDQIAPAEGGNYTQAQAQAQAQEEEKAQLSSLGGLPEPGCNSDDGPELRRLMELHRDGQLEPVDVPLGEMPPHAGTVMRNIADHWRLLIGLRRAVGDTRPLPYARSMAVNAGLADSLGTASNAINALVRAGVVEHVGSLPPTRPGLDGTKLYAPPSGGVS